MIIARLVLATFIPSISIYVLNLYSIITSLKYHVFENIMEKGAFALLEQMLHFQ